MGDRLCELDEPSIKDSTQPQLLYQEPWQSQSAASAKTTSPAGATNARMVVSVESGSASRKAGISPQPRQVLDEQTVKIDVDGNLHDLLTPRLYQDVTRPTTDGSPSRWRTKRSLCQSQCSAADATNGGSVNGACLGCETAPSTGIVGRNDLDSSRL